MYKDRNKSKTRFSLITSAMSGISLLGCLIFLFADNINEWVLKILIVNNQPVKSFALVFTVFGFVLMQSGMVVCENCICEIIVQSNSIETFLDLWIFR